MTTSGLGPRRLAMLAIAGACIAAATWFEILIPSPHLGRFAFWANLYVLRFRLTAFLVPLCAGLALWRWASRRFRQGVLDDRWTEVELSEVRELLSRGLWGALAWCVLGVVVATLLLRYHSSAGAFVYLLLLPTNAVTGLRQEIAPSKRQDGSLTNWRSFKPIQSEHWGKGRA